jgi:hypothetical protein
MILGLLIKASGGAKFPQKIKIFIWLMTNNVVLTKDNMLKRKWLGNPICMF